MSCVALLSCLGVEGWGPRHLLLSRRGDPGALLERLGLAWFRAAEELQEEPRAAHLLASLLRDDRRDLLPLGCPLALPRTVTLQFRHRLCSRGGGRLLHLRSWQWGQAEARWRSCGAELALVPALFAGLPMGGPKPVRSLSRQARPRLSATVLVPAVHAGSAPLEQ